MTKEEVLCLLQEHRSELELLGVKSLALFGSVVRAEERPGSDIDILVEFTEPVGLFKFLDLKAYLEALLQCKVDLATRDALKRQLRDEILEEAVHAL
jgi:predicted nucleotidyltransferase